MRRMSKRFLIAAFLAPLSGCIGGLGIEYHAGDLATCWSDLNIEFCRVNADRANQQVVTGTSLLGGAAQAAGVAMTDVTIAGAIRAGK